ncbi:multiple stress resistance protein BhsA [Yersinia mollaretii]|uniref:multiple stress resistance protein BhsA n=1 Tax=Yersinia mollaretii TaxID=33060 RepID=UPI0005DDF31C|nr:YdgH/BhsA/McbA-like domain containing protein [Yersinia mollaretii]CNK16049.1 Multiple stress resistance protein BhsA precursor [Yersinia enterocolitica]
MKSIKYIVPALALSFASFASVAATQIQHIPSTGLNEIGVVSASSAGTLTDLENALAKKAEDAGATSFLITSATGNNKLHGTAVIYR